MKPYLNKVSGKSNSDIVTFSGGLNVCQDKSFIKDNQMPYMWNVCLNQSPTLKTRSDRTSIAWFMSDRTNYATGKILKVLSTTSKEIYTIEEFNEENSRIFRYKLSGRSALQKVYIATIPVSNAYYMCECRDANKQYIVISTLSKRIVYTVGTDGVVVAEDDTKGILAFHKNRLWIASGTSLKFSKLREYDDFTINPNDTENAAGEINVTNAKGNITAIKPYDGKLIIFCERSRHMLYGSSPNSEIDQFSLIDFDDDIGCISDESITICDRQLYWVDSNMSVYRYNGASTVNIAEPYGSDNYASYGGIKGLQIDTTNLKNIAMSNYDTYIYIALKKSIEAGNENDTIFVYDTKNRVWWAEDGAFSHLEKWETDTKTPFYNTADYIIGSKYNGDILILNALTGTGTDCIFNTTTRLFEDQNIKYEFETKTWNLGTIKETKTLTNIWFQADANAKVGVCDYWEEYNPWDNLLNGIDDNFLVLGKLRKVDFSHNVQKPSMTRYQGKERQRFIVPKMYMQKINAFSIKVKGEGEGKFHLMQKEWRIK